MTDAVEPTGGDVAAPSPVETATAGLETLAADKAFQADWSGENGRPAQLAAVKLKADTTRAAYNPEPDTAPVLPDALADAVNDPNATEATKAMVEGMTPGTQASDYTFRFEGASTMDVEQLQDMTSTAQEAALALGASPSFARATVEYMDQQLARPDIVPVGTNTASVVEILNKRLGDTAPATLDAARAAVNKLPERSREWLFNGLDRMDANGFAYMITRLASIERANTPRS